MAAVTVSGINGFPKAAMATVAVAIIHIVGAVDGIDSAGFPLNQRRFGRNHSLGK
jgi:hypothetical protein